MISWSVSQGQGIRLDSQWFVIIVAFEFIFEQNTFIFQFQGAFPFLTRGAWNDISALFSWIVITNAFNLMLAICLHKHRILEESVPTSVQEVSWLSAVSEKSFCSLFFNFLSQFLVLKFTFEKERYHVSNLKFFCDVRLV